MNEKHLVWDLPLRIFHWSIAMAFFGLWYTSDQDRGLIEYHLILGYIVLGLVVFRLIWGIVGTKYAKFKNFNFSLTELKHYLKGQTPNNSQQSVGHNPAGSFVVCVLLAVLLLQAVSGLFINDDVFSSGPYYGSLSGFAESIMKYLHHSIFDWILYLSVLHIIAVFYYLLVKKQNLIKAMITGKKSDKHMSSNDSIGHSKLWLALIIAILVTGFVYWLVVLNAPVVEEYYY